MHGTMFLNFPLIKNLNRFFLSTEDRIIKMLRVEGYRPKNPPPTTRKKFLLQPLHDQSGRAVQKFVSFAGARPNPKEEPARLTHFSEQSHFYRLSFFTGRRPSSIFFSRALSSGDLVSSNTKGWVLEYSSIRFPVTCQETFMPGFPPAILN